MAVRFKQYVISFESASGSITGNSVLKQLTGTIDTESADVEVDEKSAVIRFVTTLTEEHVWEICDEVKKSLEKTVDDRLLYTIVVISL